MSPQVLKNIYTLPTKWPQEELAAYLLGLTFSSPLYAISICQVVLYFRTYRHDPLYLKRTVAILMSVSLDGTHALAKLPPFRSSMDSIRFVFLAHTVYSSFVTLNDVLHHVARPVTCRENHVRESTLMIVEFLGVCFSQRMSTFISHFATPKTSLSCIVQSAYVMRIWRLSNRNRLLAGVIMLLTLCEFGSSLSVTGGLVFEATGQGLGLCSFGGPFETEQTSTTLNTIYKSAKVSRYSQLCASLVSDVLITLSMIYYLKGGLKETNLFGTKSIISLLISYTLTIGLVTSILSITALAIFAAAATQVHFPAIHFMISNVYVNSFLARYFEVKLMAPYSLLIASDYRSLNWRMGLREAGQGSDLLSMQGSLAFTRERARA
ncbi:hypothetical protein BDN71DRAFT_1507940 [Pleurotus eryngii]|uniref:DUF6534 domain-containing protein n=1 Tax=Pleurotus eryngii TaxID=5323 RepID=A0A9P5ZV30_PLEER|nr:hypothetical protein BDN71DRAFT_1507940 [Pleurotus eryngii]